MLTTTKTVTDFTSPVGVVNGIDTDAVHALIESVEAQPAKGMTRKFYSSKTTCFAVPSCASLYLRAQ